MLYVKDDENSLQTFNREFAIKIRCVLIDESFQIINTSSDIFNGTETNCRIAHILGILLMNSYDIQMFRALNCVIVKIPSDIKDL